MNGDTTDDEIRDSDQYESVSDERRRTRFFRWNEQVEQKAVFFHGELHSRLYGSEVMQETVDVVPAQDTEAVVDITQKHFWCRFQLCQNYLLQCFLHYKVCGRH